MRKIFNRLKSIIKNVKCIYTSKNKAKNLLSNNFVSGFKVTDFSFLDNAKKGKIISDADKLLKNEYQIYNYSHYNGVDWQMDPITKRKIKNVISVELLKTSSLIDKIDVKNYWEQGHLHPIITLGQAYLFTGNEKYAQKVVDLIINFNVKNPLGKTICWKCSMDSAIRLSNICVAITLISSSKHFILNEVKLQKLILEHIIYISSNYENKGRFLNNHYLSNLVGVIIGCAYIYKNYNNLVAFELLEKTIRIFENEVFKQVNADGFSYEYSSYYHCFVLELLLETKNILDLNNIKTSKKFSDLTEKMLEVALELGGLNNKLVLIGDQDGSRLFHYFGCFDIDRCDFSSLKRFYSKEVQASTRSAGIYILKDAKNKVYFKCGGIGTGGNGTHDHNDQLSIVVILNNECVVCDSGTYCYTKNSIKRFKYRSTQAHSTVHFNDLEQNDVSNMFSFKSANVGKVIKERDNFILGEFKYSNNLKHEREIKLEENVIKIKDRIEKGISRLIVPIEKDKILKVKDNEIIFTINKVNVKIISSNKIELKEAFISKAYGMEINATYVDSEVFLEHHYTIERE